MDIETFRLQHLLQDRDAYRRLSESNLPKQPTRNSWDIWS